MIVQEEQYLAHYGVLGMKWGKRKAKPKFAEGYSERPRTHDESVYGKRGMKRINKDIQKGNSVQGARSKEAKRSHSAKRHLLIEAGKMAVGNAAYAVGAQAASKVLSSAVGKGKISATSAYAIGRGAATARSVLNFYQGIKVSNLAVKSVLGFNVYKGYDY